MKSKPRVRWITPVGSDASTGGGVARAVGLFKDASILDVSNYYSLVGMNKWEQFLLAFKDVYFHKYRCFVVHSFFTPYVFLLLLLPCKGKVVILPHGELKSGALQISKNFKMTYIRILSVLGGYVRLFKEVSIIASNNEEIQVANNILTVSKSLLARDLVSSSIPIKNNQIYDSLKGINLVVISRLVPNKGVSELLLGLIERRKNYDLSRLEAIHLFIQTEDLQEANLVKKYLSDLRSYGVNVFTYEGLGKAEIESVTKLLPNKLAFLSSKFESFSYVLLETLYFEYPPMVWFGNELVDEVIEHRLCVRVPFGYFPSDEELKELPLQDLQSAMNFLDSLSREASSTYINYFEEVF